MSASSIAAIVALSLFALALVIGIGWAIVTVITEICGCDDDPETIFPEAPKADGV